VDAPEVRHDDLEVRTSTIHGRGVFARRPIPAATRIIEYTGEVISDEEADRRYDEPPTEHHHTFLFALGNGSCIDARVGGNIARFINHACDPNCEAVDVDGHIWVEAIRDIAPGEELSYDYGYEWAPDDDASTSLYVCRCGVPNCRKTMLTPSTTSDQAPGERRSP
jgi:SET domain-containing protein